MRLLKVSNKVGNVVRLSVACPLPVQLDVLLLQYDLLRAMRYVGTLHVLHYTAEDDKEVGSLKENRLLSTRV